MVKKFQLSFIRSKFSLIIMNYQICSHLRSRKKITAIIFLLGISIAFIPSASGYLLPRTNLDLYLEHELIVMGQVSSLRDFIDDFTSFKTLKGEFLKRRLLSKRGAITKLEQQGYEHLDDLSIGAFTIEGE